MNVKIKVNAYSFKKCILFENIKLKSVIFLKFKKFCYRCDKNSRHEVFVLLNKPKSKL